MEIGDHSLMRYEVPQFIEVEDKIFGPLTFKQFVYLAGASGVCVTLYVLYESFFITILFGAPFVVLALALSFYEINSQPFVDVMRAAFEYTFHRKLYLWEKQYRTDTIERERPEEMAAQAKPIARMSANKLKELAYTLDMQDGAYREEGGAPLLGTKHADTPKAEPGAPKRDLPPWLRF